MGLTAACVYISRSFVDGIEKAPIGSFQHKGDVGIVRDSTDIQEPSSFDEVRLVASDDVIFGIGHGFRVSEKSRKASIVEPGNELLHGFRGTHPVVAVGRPSVL